jgi:hypothetical protein
MQRPASGDYLWWLAVGDSLSKRYRYLSVKGAAPIPAREAAHPMPGSTNEVGVLLAAQIWV